MPEQPLNRIRSLHEGAWRHSCRIVAETSQRQLSRRRMLFVHSVDERYPPHMCREGRGVGPYPNLPTNSYISSRTGLQPYNGTIRHGCVLPNSTKEALPDELDEPL